MKRKFMAVFLLTAIALIAMSDGVTPTEAYELFPYDRGVSLQCYSDGMANSVRVKRDLKRMLRRYRRHWPEQTIDQVVQALQFGHNHPKFRIDYRLVLSLGAHESGMRLTARNRNAGGTVDYGWLQHNSCCIRSRFKRAVEVEDRYDIVDGPVSSWEFNPATQTLATILFLRNLRNELETRGRQSGRLFTQRQWILSYNMGFNGMLRGSKPISFRNYYHGEVMKGFAILR